MIEWIAIAILFGCVLWLAWQVKGRDDEILLLVNLLRAKRAEIEALKKLREE